VEINFGQRFCPEGCFSASVVQWGGESETEGFVTVNHAAQQPSDLRQGVRIIDQAAKHFADF
jgi:hypothetical protein